MSPATRRRVRRTALAAALYAVVAVALSWPLILHLDERVLGDATHPGHQGDLFFTYNLQVQMEQGRWPDILHTDLLRHPEGLPVDSRVAFSAHQAGNVVLMTVLGLMASRNLTALLILVLNALAMHLLVRERSGREWYAYVGGLLFGFGPFAFLKVDQGFFQKATLFAVPLFLLFLFRVIESGRRRDQILCGLLLLVMLAIYPPYAVFSVVFGGLLVLGQGLRDPRSLAKRFAPLAAFTVMAFAGVGLALQGDPRPTTMEMGPQSYSLLGGYLDPLSPFRWFPYEHTFELPPCPLIPRLPLGLPILITALAVFAGALGVRYARTLGLVSLALLVVMIGPYLAPDGDARGAVALPFYYLGQLPMGSVLKFPIRLYPWVLIAMVIAAGGGLRAIEGTLKGRWPRVAQGLFPAVLVLVIAENRLVFPEYGRFLVTTVPVPQFYEDTRSEEFAALLMLPTEPLFPNDHLVVPPISGRRLINGYMDQPGSLAVPGPGADGAALARFREALVDLDVGYVVVKLAPWEVARAGSAGPPWLEGVLGPPRVYPADALVAYPVTTQD